MEKIINGLIIDPIIFTHPFVQKCNVAICSGECCWYGVYADKEEMGKILQHKELFKRFMDETQTKDDTLWFEPIQEDKDFKSGFTAGTQVFNYKCIFLDKNGFCTLQRAAVEQNEFKWKYKPLYCILFPLTIYEGKLTIDDEHLADMHYCSKCKNQTSTIFDAMNEEIKYLLGEEGYSQLLEFKKELGY